MPLDIRERSWAVSVKLCCVRWEQKSRELPLPVSGGSTCRDTSFDPCPKSLEHAACALPEPQAQPFVEFKGLQWIILLQTCPAAFWTHLKLLLFLYFQLLLASIYELLMRNWVCLPGFQQGTDSVLQPLEQSWHHSMKGICSSSSPATGILNWSSILLIQGGALCHCSACSSFTCLFAQTICF